MVNYVYPSLGGPIPNNLWGWPKDLKIYEMDMEKAKQELVPWRKGTEARGVQPSGHHPKANKGDTPSKIAALYLQSQASELGLKMNVQEETFPVLAAAAVNPKTTHDIWIHHMSAYYLDPDNWIGKTYSSFITAPFLAQRFITTRR